VPNTINEIKFITIDGKTVNVKNASMATGDE